MIKMVFRTVITVFLISVAACDSRRPQEAGPGEDWLSVGSVDDRFSKVSKHLRGFDMAMVETGYRYVELYWAGQDKNWEYAEYQLGKIRTAITNGTERRPGRAASAKVIFPALDQLGATITEQDLNKFNIGFRVLTQTCNSCHSAERMSFFKVDFPSHRLSPISNTSKSAKEKRASK